MNEKQFPFFVCEKCFMAFWFWIFRDGGKPYLAYWLSSLASFWTFINDHIIKWLLSCTEHSSGVPGTVLGSSWGNHTESSLQCSEGRIIIPTSRTQVGLVPSHCFSPLGWHFGWSGTLEGCGYQKEEDSLIRASLTLCQAVCLLLHICYLIWSL